MNWNRLTAIVKKDLLEVKENKFIWAPMIIVPALFVIIYPLAILLIPVQVESFQASLAASMSDLKMFLDKMPASVSATLANKTPLQTVVIIMLGYIFAPLFLIFPLMFSTIIAAESFAGEYERKTIEALLYTPATDAELFMGKVLTAFIPTMLISWLSFIIYTLILNLAGYPLFGEMWFPMSSWYPLIFWITPALAILGISTTILISAKTRTFMGAYQSSSALVLLVVGLLAGQMTGVLYLSVETGLLIGLVIWVVAGVLTYFAIKKFSRSHLLTGLKI